MQARKCPQENTLRFGAHLFRNIRIVFPVRVFFFGGKDNLSAEKAHTVVIDRLQDAVAQADKAHIQIALIALLSLFLQIHRQFCGDDCLDVIGSVARLPASYHRPASQAHAPDRHERRGLSPTLAILPVFMLLPSSARRTIPMRLLPSPPLPISRSIFCPFGGGDKAIPHELLQGKNVLRLQKLR